MIDRNECTFEPLGNHDRAAFCCGKEALDAYIREQASQDVKRKLAVVFVCVKKDNPQRIIAYHTLSNRELKIDQLPPNFAKKVGKYGFVPVTLLGRMAVDRRYQGQHLGEMVLMDALYRSSQTAKQVASFAVVVDAKDEEAARFYLKYEFIELPESRLKLFLPMRTIENLFRDASG